MTNPNAPAPELASSDELIEVASDIQKLIESAPPHIWLDLGENLEALTAEGTFRDLKEVTWSEDNATGTGIKYVRAPQAGLGVPGQRVASDEGAAITSIKEMCAILDRQLIKADEYTDCAIVYRVTFDQLRSLYDLGRTSKEQP